MKKVKLSNGLVIGNLSSPHQFIFEDGSILEAVDKETTKEFSIKFDDIETQNNNKFMTVEKKFIVEYEFYHKLEKICYDFEGEVILVPFMLISALKANNFKVINKLHTVHIKDRVNKLVSIDKFCR